MQIFTSPTCRGGDKILDFDGGVATVILSGAKNLKTKNATRPFVFTQGDTEYYEKLNNFKKMHIHR